LRGIFGQLDLVRSEAQPSLLIERIGRIIPFTEFPAPVAHVHFVPAEGQTGNR
jgi:hypothetical protein